MKKFLSLVLALVMTMSLVTVAGATDFTDDADIDYKAAIDVMYELDIIDGYGDGSLRPDTKLNRGQAAKIICNLLLGPTGASALPTKVAPFPDVAAGSTFAGYIAYCAEQGIINGYTDGTFRPQGQLTGFAFMKMLLGALGYDGEVEGFASPNWAVNVAKLVMNIGLASGLEDDFNGNLQVSRQEAMLYCFNMLTSDMVEYDNKSSISIGDITITTESDAEIVMVSTSAYDNNFSRGSDTNSLHALQFAEKHFPDLTNRFGQDANGRPLTNWYEGKEKIAVETNEPDYVCTTTFTEGDMYKDMDVSDGYSFYTYTNGTSSGVNNANKGSSVKVYGNNKGVIAEFYIDYLNGGNDGILVLIDPEIVELDEVDEDEDGRFVENNSNTIKYYTEDFEEGDLVLVHYGDDNNVGGVDCITYMTKVEKQTGKLTKSETSTTGEKYTIDGVTYEASDSLYEDIDSNNEINVGDTVDYWLDENGYVLKMDLAASSITVEDMALVMTAGTDRGPWAQLLFSDGTKKYVDTDKLNNYSGNRIVSFEVDGSTYELTDVPAGKHFYGSTTNHVFNNGTATITGSWGTQYVDGGTVFVICDTTNDEIYSFTGIENAPSFKNAMVVGADTDDKDTRLDLVYVFAVDNDIEFSTDSVVFTIGNNYNYTEEDGVGTYYVVNAIVDGEWSTINIKKGVGGAVDADGVTWYTGSTNPLQAWNVLNKNAKGLVTSGSFSGSSTEYTLTEAQSTYQRLSKSVVELGGTTYAVAKGVNVYVVNADLDEMKVSSVDKLSNDDNGANGKDHYSWITFTTNGDGQVTNIVAIER